MSTNRLPPSSMDIVNEFSGPLCETVQKFITERTHGLPEDQAMLLHARILNSLVMAACVLPLIADGGECEDARAVFHECKDAIVRKLIEIANRRTTQ